MEWINEKAKTLKQGAIRAMFDRANTMTGVISPELSQIVDNLISVAKENVINVNELLLKTKQNMEDE